MSARRTIYALCCTLSLWWAPEASAAPGDERVEVIINVISDGRPSGIRRIGMPTRNQLMLGMAGLVGSVGSAYGVYGIERWSGNSIDIHTTVGCASVASSVTTLLGYMQLNRINMRPRAAQRANSIDMALGLAANVGIPTLINGVCVKVFGNQAKTMDTIEDALERHSNPRKLLDNEYWYDHALSVAREGAERFVAAENASDKADHHYRACRAFHGPIYCAYYLYGAQRAAKAAAAAKVEAKRLIDAADNPLRTHAADLGLPLRDKFNPGNETIRIPTSIVLP